MHSQRGFSLIELMVTVVIVAILAGIAIPSYQEFVKKSRRAAAKSTLLDMAAKQENFFSDLKKYTGDATDLGYPSDPFWLDSDGNVFGSTGTDRTYKVTLSQTAGDVYSYSIIAEAVERQSNDSHCTQYSIDHQGTRSQTPIAHTDCW